MSNLQNPGFGSVIGMVLVGIETQEMEGLNFWGLDVALDGQFGKPILLKIIIENLGLPGIECHLPRSGPFLDFHVV